jgi:hypothetical protein
MAGLRHLREVTPQIGQHFVVGLWRQENMLETMVIEEIIEGKNRSSGYHDFSPERTHQRPRLFSAGSSLQ